MVFPPKPFVSHTAVTRECILHIRTLVKHSENTLRPLPSSTSQVSCRGLFLCIWCDSSCPSCRTSIYVVRGGSGMPATSIRRRKKTKWGGIVYSFVGVDLDHRTVGRTRERLRTEPRPPVHFVCLFFARKALSGGLNHLILHCFEVGMMCAVHCMGQKIAPCHTTP